MAIGATKLCRSLFHFHYSLRQISSIHSITSSQTLEESIKAAVESKTYQKIPDLLISLEETCLNPNPFSFLSTFSQNLRTQVVDEILQSFIPLRPRSRPQIAYACLLSFTLQSANPLPLALAILQRTLRSGCIPVPQTHLLLSSAWLSRRRQSHSVSNILSEMQSIGYYPDCGTCNYLILSLCAIDQLVEAVIVLKSMGQVGCIPDLEGYGSVIGAMCAMRRTTDATELMKEMVAKIGLTPRQGTVLNLVAALRAKKEIWKAVEMIEFLEGEDFNAGFASYESVLEGCLACHEFVLAGKVVMGMTARGFIPYIGVRQKVVEGLANLGEWKLALAVRQRFADLRS
ncbi:hypothetical protein VitviT2T_017608 [Vitis vinifera]|uniref:Pentatricopeptide repeat-containing protein n=2 Tax=Vitis vinifera TaxID=29760 RepID=E0CTM4_VITVI|eukprot:XP_019078782.1 PREDICTED: pentatricopeptide repeat-containing protein At1g06270 [Vitis vinifera]